MSLFERISEQLQIIELRLNSLRRELDHTKISPASIESAISEVDTSTKELKRNIGHLSFFYDILTKLDGGLVLHDAIEQALDSIWQKIPLSYAVLILGEAELGPYYYLGIKGIEKSWQYLGKECPFPLSGVLAQTLLCKQDPTSVDYLCIDDIRTQKRPSTDEFPWLPQHGSTLILPLRLNKLSLAKGALIVGRSVQGGFSDLQLRQEFQDIAQSLVQLIYHAQMHHELARQTEHLVNIHLLTREIARAQNVDDIIHVLAQRVSEVINDVDIAIYLRSIETIYDPQIDPNEPNLREYRRGDLQNRPLSPQLRDLIAWTMRVGEPIFYHASRLEEDPEHPFYSVSGPAMIVPIVGKEHTFGVIQVRAHHDARHFDETDTLVMRSLSNSVAIALKGVDLDISKAQLLTNSLQMLIAQVEEETDALSGHSQRVAHNTGLIVRSLELDNRSWLRLRTAAALHNVHILIDTSTSWSQEVRTDQDTFQQQIARSSKLLRQIGIHPAIVHIVEQMARPYGVNDYSMNDYGATDYTGNDYSLDEIISSLSLSAADIDDELDTHSLNAVEQQALYRNTQRESGHRHSVHSTQALEVQKWATLGPQIVCIAAQFDTWLCTASRWQSSSLEAQLQYLNRQLGLTLEPALVQLFGSLLRENRLLLPGRIVKRSEVPRI